VNFAGSGRETNEMLRLLLASAVATIGIFATSAPMANADCYLNGPLFILVPINSPITICSSDTHDPASVNLQLGPNKLDVDPQHLFMPAPPPDMFLPAPPPGP
jgi:hypothetical protein